MATQIGPRIGIEGEKEYRAQIQQIIQQTKTLDSSMKATAAAWDKNTSAMTKNAAKAQNLAQQIDLQKTKMQSMNTMLEKSKEKFGENATQTLKWQQAVNEATASLNAMEVELKELGNAGNFSALQMKMADIGQSMQNIGSKMVGVGRNLSMSITVPLVAAGTAAVNLASNMEESSSKVDVVFGNMAESVKEFTDTSLEAYGVSNVKAMTMIGTFGAMATSLGLSKQQAAEMATTLTGLAGDMASFHNSQVDITNTALTGIFTGETEALKKFGIAMTETNLEEFAKSQGKVYKTMDQAEKVMTRYQFILQNQAAAIGDYQRTSEGTANSINTFKGSLEELGVVLGEKILPIITPIIQKITDMVQAFAELPEPVQKVIDISLLLAAVLGPVILLIGGLASAIGAAAPALAAIGAALAGVAAGIAIGAAAWDAYEKAAWVVQNASSIIQHAFNILMNLNKHLKDSVNNAVQAIVSAFASMPGKIFDALMQAAQKVKDTFNAMIENAKQSGKDFIEGFVDGIKEKLSKVVETVKKVAKTIQDYLGFSCPDKGPLHEYETWMPDMMAGLAKGIRQNLGLVTGAINDVASTMAIPIDANAGSNISLAGEGAGYVGGTTMNVYVDHISELSDLIRIQNQAQQMSRMGAK